MRIGVTLHRDMALSISDLRERTLSFSAMTCSSSLAHSRRPQFAGGQVKLAHEGWGTTCSLEFLLLMKMLFVLSADFDLVLISGLPIFNLDKSVAVLGRTRPATLSLACLGRGGASSNFLAFDVSSDLCDLGVTTTRVTTGMLSAALNEGLRRWRDRHMLARTCPNSTASDAVCGRAGFGLSSFLQWDGGGGDDGGDDGGGDDDGGDGGGDDDGDDGGGDDDGGGNGGGDDDDGGGGGGGG
eukprot:766543-Hanusia_phi.AAC.4